MTRAQASTLHRGASAVQVDLPRLDITYASDWAPTLTLAGSPHELPDLPAAINPRNPRDVGRLVALELEQAVHVVAVNPDGATYSEICIPEPLTSPNDSPDKVSLGRGSDLVPDVPPGRYPFGIVGVGFVPGEQVSFAVVVASREAEVDGSAELPLPAALAGSLASAVLLLGRTSGTIVVHDPAAETDAGDGTGAP